MSNRNINLQKKYRWNNNSGTWWYWTIHVLPSITHFSVKTSFFYSNYYSFLTHVVSIRTIFHFAESTNMVNIHVEKCLTNNFHLKASRGKTVDLATIVKSIKKRKISLKAIDLLFLYIPQHISSSWIYPVFKMGLNWTNFILLNNTC